MTNMTVKTRQVDRKGRLTLGKEFASALVLVKQVSEGLLQIVRAEAVPAPEAWLYKNPEALKMVMEGIADANAGRLGDGPDLEAGDKLAATIED